MTPDPHSLVRAARQYGPMDPVFDGLLFTGPLVILCVVLLGRGPISEALVATYLAVLVARTAQKAL